MPPKDVLSRRLKRKSTGSAPGSRAHSQERSGKKARHYQQQHNNSNDGDKRHSSYDKTFLTEEELLACYYPLPKAPLPPPSPAFLSRLHAELAAYNAAHVPTAAMQSARWSIVRSVQTHARQLWGPEVDVLPFGSFVTNLYLASSDVDLVVLNVSGGKKQVNALLLALGNRLRAHGVARDVTMIPGARVPLLKYVDTASGLDVDVSLGLEDGVRSGNFMKALGEHYPAFRPLTLFLKAFMQARGLADVFRGGVSSYILQCMILFHLQVQELMHGRSRAEEHRVVACDAASLAPTANLGYLLYTFFELFGYTFSYEEHGMRLGDIRDNNKGKSAAASGSSEMPRGLDCYVKRLEPGRLQPMRPFLMSLEDPIQHGRDIGGACFGIRRVRRCFALAREFLCRMPEDPAEGGQQQQKGQAKPAAAAPTSDAAASFFVVDTVGDSGNAASSSAAAASAAASSAAAVATPAASAADSSAHSFSSSFGFLLQSLLDMPVRYSVSELERASRKQPAWVPVVEKLRRLENLLAKKEAKTVRRKEREKSAAVAAAAAKAAAAAAASAVSTPKSKPRVAPSGTPIDLTSLDSPAGPSHSAQPQSAPRSAASAATPARSDDDDEDDSDIEILEGPRAPKPIPIDELDAAEADDAAAAAEEAEAEGRRDAESGAASDADALAEAQDASSSDADALAEAQDASSAAGDEDDEQEPDHAAGELPPIDGDAMLAADEEDENMTLNLR